MNMQQDWWYADGDARRGPVDIANLRNLLLERKVSKGTLVWKEGRESWTPLGEVAELNPVGQATPPELPKDAVYSDVAGHSLAGAGRRFWARFIDLWLIALPTSFAASFALSSVSLSFGLWIQKPGSEYAFGWLVLPLVLLIEAGIFAVFGSTPGKAILGVSVTSIDSRRLTGAEYLRRQLGVYWHGLGTGFPLVPLFTMARQYSHLRAGRTVPYDDGRFRVTASKLSVLRVVLAVFIAVGLLLVNSVLRQMSNVSGRAYYSGSTWVNPVTGRSVSVPGGWIHQEEKNSDQQTVHTFSGPNHGIYVVLAKEDLPSNMDLDTYVDAWIMAVRSQMRVAKTGPQTLVGSYPGVVLTGSMADDRTQLVHATLVKKGRQVWRVVLLSSSGKDPAPQAAVKLRGLLFASLD
jgi:uncharacterized RDD family membrane protein YckC